MLTMLTMLQQEKDWKKVFQIICIKEHLLYNSLCGPSIASNILMSHSKKKKSAGGGCLSRIKGLIKLHAWGTWGGWWVGRGRLGYTATSLPGTFSSCWVLSLIWRLKGQKSWSNSNKTFESSDSGDVRSFVTSTVLFIWMDNLTFTPLIKHIQR